MERILVIGSPGAGKSCFSRELARVTGLPLYHIDNIYWNERSEHLSRAELIERLLPILNGERWIVDGNYSATFPLRLSYATTVILLDIDLALCERGIIDRVGKARADIPFVEDDTPQELLEAARSYEAHTLPKMLQALEEHPRVKLLRFDTREKAYEFLERL